MKQVPKKPKIRKLGTVKCDVVESSPFVLGDHLYRMEYFRAARRNKRNDGPTTWMKVFDMESQQEVASLAKDHHLGSAFSDGEAVFISATAQCEDPEQPFLTWGGSRVDIYRSTDVKTWEPWGSVTLEGTYLFNTAMCKKDGIYTLAIETGAKTETGVDWSVRFAQSADGKEWTVLPEECCFEKGQQTGNPAIYVLPDDPYYYVFTIRENLGPYYTTDVVRSRDLIHWEYSPVNPVLIHDAEEDKKLAHPFFTLEEQQHIEQALDCNNSDLELCEFRGRTIIYYSWGDQKGTEFLAEACYEGSMKDFLQGWFEIKE